MLKGQKSFRSIVIASILIVATTITATASWSDYINPFAYFGSSTYGSNIELATANQPATMIAVGTCDGGSNVDVESSGGTPLAGYATLKLAFDAINAGTHTGTIIVEICTSTTEGTVPMTLFGSGQGAASYSSINVYPIADAVTVSGAQATGFGIVHLKGTDNVTIDGDNPNTAGTNRNLTFQSTSATTVDLTSVIRIATVNSGGAASADNVTIKNVNILGNATGRNGATFTNTSAPENRTWGIYVGGNGGSTAVDAATALSSVSSNTVPASTTVNGLLIENNSINVAARGITFNGSSSASSTGITIQNNVIGAAGVLAGAPPYTTPASTIYAKGIHILGTNAVSISGNTIQNVLSYVATLHSGIELESGIGSGTISISNNTISGVVINANAGSAARGISVASAGAPYSIAGNTITNIQNFCSSTTITNQPNGIFVGTAATAATIERNRVSQVYDRNTGTFGVAGVHFNSGNNITFQNNFIWDVNQNMSGGAAFSTTFGVHGLRIVAGTGHKIYHNSINMSGTLFGTAASSHLTSAFAVSATSLTGIDVRNNIFANTMTGGTTSIAHVSMFLPTSGTSAMNLTLNNNNYHTGSTAGVHGVAHVGTTYTAVPAGPATYAGLYTTAAFDPANTTPTSNLRAYTSTLSASGTNDNASKKDDPLFVSSTDLHIQSSSTMESAGTNAGVTTDIDGDSRGATPDIGADEITLAGPGTVQFSTTSYTDSEGNTATITVNRTGGVSGAISVDYAAGGGTATGGAACTAGVDYITPTPGTLSWANADAAAKTFNVQLCTDTDTPETESLDLTLSNPIGTSITGTNPVPLNITDVPPPLNGDYQVPGDYATLTAAVADYNIRGVSGPVRFLLNNATYDTGAGETFPIVIATTGPDTTATNTLTIQPNAGITSAIVGSSVSGIVVIADQFVTINGDNVGGDIARNLTVNNTATTANSYVVGLFNFGGTKVARSATVRYSNIRGGVTAVGTVSWGIILNGSGGDYDNVLIENNKIWQAYVGIGHYGVAATGINNNNIIRNNIIGDTTGSNESIKLRGIEVTQSSGLTIDGNDVFGLPAGNSNSTQAGILLSTGGANNTVTRNNIHDFYYTGTGGLSTHGILISENGGTTNITNNFIHNIKADGDVFNTATNILWMPAGITISGTTTGTLNIDHNSIYMSGATLGSSFTGNSACFSSVAGVTGVNFRNNALRNSMTTVGAPDPGNKTYAIATIGAGSLGTMFSAIDNNTYFVNGTNPNTGTFGQTDRVNLAAFQAATTQDASSQDVDPQFVSTIDLHLSNPLNTVVGGGTPLAGVTVDYDSDPRPALSPDIGADEIVQAEGGSIAAGSYYNAALATGETIGGNVTVNNRLYLNGVIDPGVNTLTMGCGASVVGGGPTSYISGAMTKNYCGAENFTFPVGMGGFYSPANVDVTAVGVNPSSLTVRPHDALLVGFDPLETLSRNWQLDEVGDITANLQFFYDDSDVNGNESDYRMWRREGTGTDTNLCAGGPCVDTVNNILGPVNGVTTFSRWTGSKPLAPTSSAASVSGRVVTANGQGIRGAAIVITGNSLPTPIIVKTGSLGYFQADNLDTGQTYVVTIVSKRFTFSQPSRVINLADNINDVDFMANPLE